MIHRIAIANFKYSKPCSVSFNIKKIIIVDIKKNIGWVAVLGFFFVVVCLGFFCHENNAGVRSLLLRN